MALFLHDSLRGKKVLFKPINPKRVTMYLCGPTVYDHAHIGNARPAVVFDVLVRLLRRSYELTFVRNITDLDDKINEAALQLGKPISNVTQRYIESYNAAMLSLGVAEPDIEPHATHHIDEMINMIMSLIDKGYAYEAEHHVLFDVLSYKNYGKLSRRDLREMIAGARVEVAPFKKSAQDFVLWKPSTSDLPGWDSPWGRGRPGWHMECSAMVKKYLGKTIDIHAGGQDLIFPHHENEIAQSTCANDTNFLARYWLHNGFLSISSAKMSKSLGNVLIIQELLKTVDGEVLRLALLNAHYRKPLDWSVETTEMSKSMLDRLYGSVRGITVTEEMRNQTKPPKKIIAALEDDLNTPKALAELFNLAKQINKTKSEDKRRNLALEIYAATDLMGFLKRDPEVWFSTSPYSRLTEQEINTLLEKREVARKNKDFLMADKIRNELKSSGVSIEDSDTGTRWRRS